MSKRTSLLDLLRQVEDHCTGIGALLAKIRHTSQSVELGLRPMFTGPVARDLTADSDPSCSLRGSTRFAPIADLLGLLSSHRKTGTLKVTTETEAFTFELVEGRVVHASSDRSRQELLLGNVLIEKKSITPQQLEQFFRSNGGERGRIGDALERAGLVDREDLREALEYQVQRLFRELSEVGDAVFSFHDRDASEIDQRIEMNVTQLLLDCARQSDEARRGRQPVGEALMD